MSYLRNDARYGHSYNGMLIENQALYWTVIHNDLEWSWRSFWWPIFYFWLSFNIFGTDIRRLYFGILRTDGFRQVLGIRDAELPPKGAWPRSHMIPLKFGDPSISVELIIKHSNGTSILEWPRFQGEAAAKSK